MLVISRKIGESVIIAGDIRITVVSLGGDKVSIGIDAPLDIKIMREELLETTLANQEASESPSDRTPANLAELMKYKSKK